MFVTLGAAAQTVPAGYCGVEYSYDAAGNRIKRKYVCVASLNSLAAIAPEEKSEAVISGIYPNPNNGRFNINFSKGIPPSQMLIFDITGKPVTQKKISGTKTEIDISHLPDGIYFISLDYFGKKITEKIVKVR
jgi:hypothetical protein